MVNRRVDDEARIDRGTMDPRVVEDFGAEWARFRNEALSTTELTEMFDDYTSIFPWSDLPVGAVGFDAGCGSGRWARFFAPRVGWLHCVDASSEALDVARQVLSEHENVEFHHSDLGAMDIPEESCDFGYSLGVLHHVPDTEAATAACVRHLKVGAPFLVYLYYDLGEAGVLRRGLLTLVTRIRRVTSVLPMRLKVLVADLIALLVYLPIARFARLMEKAGSDPSRLPLFQYRDRSFYVMRNDSLDRFGTRLEKRYGRDEIRRLLEGAGLEKVTFSEAPPWWVVVGWRSSGAAPGPCA